jgi:FlaA1/EpsC-like NDP-sugar epimerase
MYLKYGKRDFNIKNINIIGLQKGENMHEKIAENELPSNQAQFYTLNELINIL